MQLAAPGLAPARNEKTVAQRPVRVCFMIDRLSRAGTETQLLALIRELDRNRVEPSLVLLDGEDELSRSLEPDSCPILRLGLNRLLGRSTFRAAQRLQQFWHTHSADVLQAYFLDSAYFAVPLAVFSGIRKIVRVRNNLGYWLTPRHRLLNRLIGPFVNYTITNSELGQRAVTASERISPERVVVLENGVDLQRFNGLRPPFYETRTIRIGCVANLRPVKNIDGLMRIARRVCDRFPQVIFEVAGDGEQRSQLEQLARELQLGDRFRLRGSVSDVPGFLGSVDIAVLPSHSEGMSNALLEYMAAGRAVVATDVGANSQLVQQGVSGLIVPAGDESAFIQALTELINQPQRARQMGESGHATVAMNYSREVMCQRFEQFYQLLISQ